MRTWSRAPDANTSVNAPLFADAPELRGRMRESAAFPFRAHRGWLVLDHASGLTSLKLWRKMIRLCRNTVVGGWTAAGGAVVVVPDMQPVERFRHEYGRGGVSIRRLDCLRENLPRHCRKRIAFTATPATGLRLRCRRYALRDRFYRCAEQRLNGVDAFAKRRCARLAFRPAVRCLAGGGINASARALDPALVRCSARFRRAIGQVQRVLPPWRR